MNLSKEELEVIARLCLPLIKYEDKRTLFRAGISCRLFYQILEKRIISFWIQENEKELKSLSLLMSTAHSGYLMEKKRSPIEQHTNRGAFMRYCREKMPDEKTSDVLQYASATWMAMSAKERRSWQSEREEEFRSNHSEEWDVLDMRKNLKVRKLRRNWENLQAKHNELRLRFDQKWNRLIG